MPDGFIGTPALNYLNDALNALREAVAVHDEDPFAGLPPSTDPPLPALPERLNEKPPYTAESAGTGTNTTGVGNSANIVIVHDTYHAVGYTARFAADQIRDDLTSLVRKIDDLCAGSFRMPRTAEKCAVLTAAILGSMDTRHALTMDKVEIMTAFRDEALSLGGGSRGDKLVWNRHQGEAVRSGCENALRKQKSYMLDTVGAYKSMAGSLEIDAQAESRIAATAVKPELRIDPVGEPYIAYVEDMEARAVARGRASVLRDRSEALSTQSRRIERYADELDKTADRTNELYSSLRGDLISIELRRTAEMKSAADTASAFRRTMEMLRDSFDPAEPTAPVSELLKSLGEHMRANSLRWNTISEVTGRHDVDSVLAGFGTAGGPYDWEAMRRVLARPDEDITSAEIAALARVCLGIGTPTAPGNDLEAFFRLFAERADNGFPRVTYGTGFASDAAAWSFRNSILGLLLSNIESLAEENLAEQATLGYRDRARLAGLMAMHATMQERLALISEINAMTGIRTQNGSVVSLQVVAGTADGPDIMIERRFHRDAGGNRLDAGYGIRYTLAYASAMSYEDSGEPREFSFDVNERTDISIRTAADGLGATHRFDRPGGFEAAFWGIGGFVRNFTMNVAFANGLFRELIAKETVTGYHYGHNRNLDFSGTVTGWTSANGFSSDGYIIRQAEGTVAHQVRMGFADFSTNACGWVAVYNSLKWLGADVAVDAHPANLVRWIEQNDALIWDGRFGTNPDKFDEMFAAWGVNAQTTYANKVSGNLDFMVMDSSSAILNYVNEGGLFKGVHNVTVIWNPKEQKFDFYNVNGILYHSTINEFLSERADSLISITLVYE